MISLRSEKVPTLVLPVLFLVAVQCLVGEAKVYNLNLLQIFEPQGACFRDRQEYIL
jgi:hypothetical protein